MKYQTPASPSSPLIDPTRRQTFLISRTLDELNEHLNFLETEKGLKGLIIRTAKPKIFIAGADLKAFTEEISAERIAAVIERGQKTFDRIALLPYPDRGRHPWRCTGGRF